ncbi:hypothetical protein GUA87_08850 [Sneathiella sp. P13V-1]|uniref:antibiotic biosynthesis monooxygenase family protein n=1 Tax=Sneathiella sp. P13V-1 TaxID=2697366 RepID=UPI00187BBA6C|nr:antibiotic biosynthesis monooxygenase family protein [Sneathiella sp. P13V-1]MBE7636951.1 hypothetical protein [Sneathiella sp. P13V-1]
MIIRIFRVQIKPELREEFEGKFKTASVQSIEGQVGFISAEIGFPTDQAPDEYTMISRWKSKTDLIDFLGEKWGEAHIPSEMQKYLVDCWVHHYEA